MSRRALFAGIAWASLGLAIAPVPAAALSLEEAYLASARHDADLLAARSARDESVHGVAVARAPLLPQISYTDQKNRSNTYTDYVTPRPPQTDYDSGKYDSRSSSLSVRQALFRKPTWDALQVAQSQADAAEAGFAKEAQNSALRLIGAYLDVLAQRANAQLAEKETAAMEAWFVGAEQSFKAGRGTLTDIADARSRRDLSRARETEARIKLGEVARNFDVASGLSADAIPDIDPGRLDPARMTLERKEQWLQRIEANSPEIMALRAQFEAAQSAVAQARGGHLPTVDLVAGVRRSFNDTDSSISNPAEYTTRYVGVQVAVPLFSGGGVLAQTDQALAREARIRQQLESARRKILAEAEKQFAAVTQGIELVRAHAQAVASAEQAVIGAKKGIEAGTRTIVDVLDAERRLYDAQNDHAAAVYRLALTRFRFLALASAIESDSIRFASAWLASARR